MSDWQDYIKGKKITVMGLGLLGRGIGDVRFLHEEGAQLIVTDLRSKEELASALEDLSDLKDITYILGEHRLQDFQNRDLIIKAAGVPLDSPFIAEARKNNIPIDMSTAIFAAFTKAAVVGVTGTRGKSTVAHLAYEVIRRAHAAEFGSEAVNSPMSKRVFLGGNVRGVSTLPFLREAKQGDAVILELDSWQLQGFGERKLSPTLAIFTTFLPDHMNYYHGSLDTYLDDKANIFKFQDPNDTLILGSQCAPFVQDKYGAQIKSKVVIADKTDVPRDWKIQIPGAHNRYNISQVLAMATELGIDQKLVRQVVESFKGVPGRLEFIHEVKGVKIYNDTTATTPDATIAGLRALSSTELRNTVLILGGTDKGLDCAKLLHNVPVYAKAVILLSGSGSRLIEKDLEKMPEIKFQKAETLGDAIQRGFALCKKGDNLLFSPGFSSFGMFKNEFDRGDRFATIALTLS